VREPVDNPVSTVDNPVILVGMFVDSFRLDSQACITLLPLAQAAICAPPVRSAPPLPKAARGAESPRRISETELLRGYGLDPSDWELELLERHP